MENVGCDQCHADPLSVCPLHGVNADQLRKDLMLLKSAMRMMVEMNEMLKKELTECKESNKTLKAQEEHNKNKEVDPNLRQNLNYVVTTVGQLANRSFSLNNDNNELNIRNTELQKEIEKLQASNKTLIEQRDTFLTENYRLKEENKEIREQLDSKTPCLKQRCVSQDAKVISLESEVVALKKGIAEERSIKEQLNDEIERLKQKNRKLEETNDKNNEYIQKLLERNGELAFKWCGTWFKLITEGHQSFKTGDIVKIKAGNFSEHTLTLCRSLGDITFTQIDSITVTDIPTTKQTFDSPYISSPRDSTSGLALRTL